MNSEFRNWSDIRVFLAVAREGSTLAASHKLAMAQPTVARRIDALEHAVGLTLFERDTRGFRLTTTGRALMHHAQAVETTCGEFVAKATELAEARPIRITAYSGNFSDRMIQIVSEYSSQHPGTAFEFLPSVKVLDLMAGEADIALRVTRNPPDENLICRKISDARWSIFAGKSYAERFGLPSSSKDLNDHRFITFQRKDVPNAFHKWLLDNVEPHQIVATYSEMDLMHSAIRSGQGLGISNVKLLEADDSMIRCFDEIEELTAPHQILISPDAYRRPEVKSFVKYFAPRYAEIYK